MKMTEKYFKRNGSITLVILCLVFAMFILALGISKRRSGQTQLLAMADRAQIARFYLESYSNDVMCQLRAAANNPLKKTFYDQIRQANGTGKAIDISTIYSPSAAITKLDGYLSHLSIKKEPPQLTVDFEELEYPKNMIVPQKPERKGFLKVVCTATFLKNKYRLSTRFPTRIVLPVTPLLKDFLFFADQISAEQDQNAPYGPGDKLNVLFTKDSGYEKPTRSDYPYNFSGQPWVFLFNPDVAEARKNGSIFLGRDKDNIFLNMAGENICRTRPTTKVDTGKWCDLWLIKPTFFDPAESSAKTFDGDSGAFLNSNGDPIDVRVYQMDFDQGIAHGWLHILGFSSEISVESEGHLSNAPNADPRTVSDFIGNDKAYKEGYTGTDGNGKNKMRYLAYSTPLKLHGHLINMSSNDEIEYWSNPDGTPKVGGITWDKLVPPPKAIYGNVYARFLVLSLLSADVSSGFYELPFELDQDKVKRRELNSLTKFSGSGIQGSVIDVKCPIDKSYGTYMSRIVSGGTSNSSTNVSLNRPADYRGSMEILGHEKFNAPDGVKLKAGDAGNFDKFSKDWMIRPTDLKDIKNVDEQQKAFNRSIFSRICKYYPKQADFKKAYGLEDNIIKKFLLNGVVMVGDDLELGDITAFGADFKGGMIVAKGNIKIGEVTRGITTWDDMKKLQNFVDDKSADKITSDKMLTLVSLKPSFSNPSDTPPTDCIVFKGKHYVGVHAIVLTPDEVKKPAPMIKFEPGDTSKRAIFIGGLAVSSPSMKDQVVNMGKQEGWFFYVPCMSESSWTLISEIPAEMESYDFKIDLSSPPAQN